MIPVMVNLNFQQPLILTLVSQDPSEIIQICWFDAQETIFYYYHYCTAYSFVWKPWFLVRILCWKESSENSICLKMNICNINVFTLSFEQYSASLLNKSTHSYKKTWQIFWFRVHRQHFVPCLISLLSEYHVCTLSVLHKKCRTSIFYKSCYVDALYVLYREVVY